MRNPIATLLARFLPPRGAHRADPPPVRRPVVPPSPARRSARPSADVIPADAVPLVRPYVVHWEQHCERRLQQERRIAATLATFGVDYPYGPQGCAA